MTKTQIRGMTSKWKLVVSEYEKVKNGNSKNFKTVKAICEAYQVNRRDIRKYYERWIKAGKTDESLLPQKRGPKEGLYRKLTKEEERYIVKIKRKLDASAYETLELVTPYVEAPPSMRAIYRVLKRYPLNEKRKKAIRRYEKSYPGEMVHADTKSLAKTLLVERKKMYLFGVIDDCTRLCYVELVQKQTAAQVSKACARGLRWFKDHGIRVEEVMTDNGVEFTSYTSQKAKETHFFETAISMFDVKHRYTKPYRPQTNGKIERFWKTINEECIAQIRKGLTEEELSKEIKAFMYRYNYQRRHSAIEYAAPIDKLKKIAELLPKL